ncbi:MAG: circadian clock protein KaiA [Cyanobacteria bacterium P01_A01_bin.37]
MKSKLLVYTMIKSESLETAIAQLLPSQEYDVKALTEESDFISSVRKESQTIDCLVLEDSIQVINIFDQLANLSTLIPAVVLQGDADHPAPPGEESISKTENIHREACTYIPTDGSYHSAVIGLQVNQLNQLPAVIDRSIVQFLKLSFTESIPPKAMRLDSQFQQKGQQALKQKQQNLSQKLKERLGYVGVYYKRSSANFLRYMEPSGKKQFLAQLKQDYREIILGYFSDDSALNQKIDAYVNTAFLADVPVALIVEIHMDLIDDFAKQLQIEGRSEEILLDYRLTLIDLLANLCEIYRRAIPKER